MLGCRSMTRRGPLSVVVVVAVAATLGSAGCDQVQDRLNAADRERFIEASNELVDTFDDLDTRYFALGSGELEVPEFVEAAEQDIASMESQTVRLEELAGNVTGDAREIAEGAVEAAEDVIAASRDIVAAIAAADPEALDAGIGAAEAAIDRFNAQIEEWNTL